MMAGEKGWGERKSIMYRGTPAQFFFQCVNLVIFQPFSSKFCLGEPCSNFRVGLHSDFKQLITNLGIHCALKMSGCQSFCGFMYPLKMNHQNFTLEGTLKNMSGNPGIR